MRISVAMATYNGEEFIIEQLDSLLSQTMNIDEVIICDDCSKDNTYQIIKSYIKKNKLEKSWHIYLNESNKGYANNFYSALYKATGDYVFLCDQDDIWENDKIELMVNTMEKNKNIQMLGSDFEPLYSSNDAPIISKKTLKLMKNDGSLEHIILDRKSIFIGSEGCTMCLRKKFLDTIQKYWFSGWPHDEYVWKLSLCLDGCYILHKNTLKRRLHSNNVSKRKMHDVKVRISFLENLLKSHKAMLKFAEDLRLDNKLKKLINKNIKSVEIRLNLLYTSKIIYIIKSIPYLKYFYSKKSLLVESCMAIKNKKKLSGEKNEI